PLPRPDLAPTTRSRHPQGAGVTMKRLGIAAAVSALIAAAVVLALLLPARDSPNGEVSGPPAGPYRGSRPPAAITAPDFALHDYLIGTTRQLRPVWKAYGILPAVDTRNADVHSADVRVFDRHGEWVSTLHTAVDLTPKNVAHDIRTALTRSS